ELMAQAAEGVVDIAVLYDPHGRSGLVIEKLLEERLILVSTDPAVAAAGPEAIANPESGYVLVDWGIDFKRQHAEAFPDIETPPVTVGLGALGLRYTLSHRGGGDFPQRIVRGLLAEGRLHAVADAPGFGRPAFMVYPASKPRPEWIETALQGLRHVASLEPED